jgi:protein-S-isoprenylcysteine O-methyltransferase Ste14
MSAFFIDTASREDKRPYWKTNTATGSVKVILLTFSLGLAAWILYFRKPVPPVFSATPSLKKSFAHHDRWRRHLAFSCSIVFVGRVLLQMCVFWHRRITWTEAIAEAGFIIPLSLVSLCEGAVRSAGRRFGWREGAGITIFVVGTYVNIASELERHIWKGNPANTGHLFTLGLWSFARHINYTGEILSFIGFSLFCGNWNLWIPIAMGVGMAFFSVPELDFYLARRYPEEWRQYENDVKWDLVPFVW